MEDDVKTQTEAYRPSNGTEGEIFMSCFCFRCKRDQKFSETQEAQDGCPIVADAFCYSIDDPKYPKEWVRNSSADVTLIGGEGARCTAFEKIEEPS